MISVTLFFYLRKKYFFIPIICLGFYFCFMLAPNIVFDYTLPPFCHDVPQPPVSDLKVITCTWGIDYFDSYFYSLVRGLSPHLHYEMVVYFAAPFLLLIGLVATSFLLGFKRLSGSRL